MNIQIFNKINIRNNIIYLGLLIIVLSVFFFVKKGTSGSFDVYSFNQNWSMENMVGSYTNVNLPVKVDRKRYEDLKIIKRLPGNLDVTTLNIFTIDQGLEVEIDGKVVYSEDMDFEPKGFISVPGKKWNQIPISNFKPGAILTITYRQHSINNNTVIHRMFLSRGEDFSKFLVRNHFSSLLMGFFILVIGLLSVIGYFYFGSKVNDADFMRFFAGIMIVSSIWVLMENHIIKFFLPYPDFLSFLRGVSLMLFPISLFTYLIFVDGFRQKTSIMYMIIIVKSYLIIRLILDYTSILPIVSNDKITTFMIYFSMIALVLIIFSNMHSGFDKRTLTIELSFVILFIFSIIDNYLTRKNQAIYGGFYVGIGFLVFSVFQVMILSSQFKDLFIRLQLSEKYEKFATTDGLTYLYNRFSFEENLVQINKIIENNLSKLKTCNFSIVMIDLNDLKPINDKLGHLYGDDALIRCANAVRQAFGGSGVNFGGEGKVYRIGGDEFAVILFGIDEKLLNEKIEYFHKVLDDENKDIKYHLSAAVGYAFFDENLDKKAEQLFKRADSNMYQIKEKMKGGNVR